MRIIHHNGFFKEEIVVRDMLVWMAIGLLQFVGCAIVLLMGCYFLYQFGLCLGVAFYTKSIVATSLLTVFPFLKMAFSTWVIHAAIEFIRDLQEEKKTILRIRICWRSRRHFYLPKFLCAVFRLFNAL